LHNFRFQSLYLPRKTPKLPIEEDARWTPETAWMPLEANESLPLELPASRLVAIPTTI
jgi:hypothetical protein